MDCLALPHKVGVDWQVGVRQAVPGGALRRLWESERDLVRMRIKGYVQIAMSHRLEARKGVYHGDGLSLRCHGGVGQRGGN